MQIFSRFLGTGMSILGAIFLLCGAFLPGYGTIDYLRHAPLWLLLVLLVGPALLILVCSLLLWFQILPRWLLVLCQVITIIAFLLHLVFSWLGSAFACFDVCPPGGAYFGTGFWLPLAGFLLIILGLWMAINIKQQPTVLAPPTASS